MAIRTYEQLQTLLADNSTGDISPADLRDLLDSLSIERASMFDLNAQTQTIAVADTFEQTNLVLLTGEITNSNNITIDLDGLNTVNVLGVVDVVHFLEIDGSGLPNNTTIAIQIWASDDDITYEPASTIDEYTRGAQSQTGLVRIVSDQLAEGVPKYLRSYIRSSNTTSFPITRAFMSLKSNPVIKPGP